jgi:hypothetical protein
MNPRGVLIVEEQKKHKTIAAEIDTKKGTEKAIANQWSFQFVFYKSLTFRMLY